MAAPPVLSADGAAPAPVTASHMALLGGGAAAAVTTPGALAWIDIYGPNPSTTNTLTVTLITVPISIGWSRTGAGVIYYCLNGTYANATPFTVNASDTLAWYATGGLTSGAITVTNLTTSTLIKTVNYRLTT